MKILVVAGHLTGGAIVDDKTKKVVTADYFIAHMVGRSLDDLKAECKDKKWACSEVAG